MRILNEHIQKNEFKNVYLIYGPEVYLRKQYRDKLKNAMLKEADSMNYNYFEGKGIEVKTIIGLAETMPFFADRRVIVIENSGFFSSAQEELSAYIANIPETACLIFVEESADKRSRLFKAISQHGYAANMSSPDERTLKTWIAGLLKREGRKISEGTVMKFLSTVDNNMENIKQELEKLICYTAGSDVITQADIDAVCSIHTENKIFDMIRAVAMKRQREALKLYDDLLILKEPPMRILYLIVRQFNTLLEIKDLAVKGYSTRLIAEKTGMKEFIVRKNTELTQKFSLEELKEAIVQCTELEEAVKTGRMIDQMAVEVILAKYSN